MVSHSAAWRQALAGAKFMIAIVAQRRGVCIAPAGRACAHQGPCCPRGPNGGLDEDAVDKSVFQQSALASGLLTQEET